ncbi:MAG: agmatinase [Deltaproteobacteria bacterium HGW-Deltaproteobacteria-15]|jgi:agmatinase|nr:MAG: agmatinase [Deltaproteobacteria bacterium HGW-Deltaproteobacteria-15]
MSTPIAPHFLASELGLNTSPASALFHVIPVPLERSVSYGKGTQGGPAAILEASQQLESWDGRSIPLELGIHTAHFIDCSGEIEQVLERIRQQTAVTLETGKIPVLLGGEHTVTVGALEAVCGFFPEPVGLFYLDAHADLRESYEGSRFSHASVARRAHADLGMELFQFGVRALSLEEVAYREKHNISHLDAAPFYQSGHRECSLPPTFPERIYLTLDVDGLDPSVIRATGTPVPGGPGWHDTLAVIEKVIKGKTVIGFDVVELAPRPEDHGSSFAAAQLVYSVMGLIQRNRTR